MFIPLHDTNSLKYIKVQYVTISLMVINTLIWVFTSLLASDQQANSAALGLGFIPAIMFDGATLAPGLKIVPDDATLVTYAFLHLSFWHLASNMLFLWVFGDNVEDALGHFRFLVFYILCAVAGALLHGLVAPLSQGPLIGASGAISVSLLHIFCCIRACGSGYSFSCAFLCHSPPSFRWHCGSVSNS